MAKSKITKVGKKSFRYNYDHSVVEWVTKASAEEIKDNKEWQAKYGKDLWDIDEDGYMVVDAIGLHKENWDNKEARMEYLNEWVMDIEETTAYELDMFVKCEMA